MQYCSHCGRSSEGDVCAFCRTPFRHLSGGAYRTQRDLLVASLTVLGVLFLLFCPLISYGGINLNNLAFNALVNGQMFAYIAQYSAETGFALAILKGMVIVLYVTIIISIVNLFRAIDRVCSIFRGVALGVGMVLLLILVVARIQLSQSLLGGFAGVISLAVGFGVAMIIAAVVLNGQKHLMSRVIYRVPGSANITMVDPPPVRSGSLLCTQGVFAGSSFDMNGTPMIAIGRSPKESQIVFPSGESQISRKHVQIQFSAGENCYYVTDLSRNGTYVSGGVRTPVNQPYRVERGTSLYLDKRGRNKFILQ